MSEPSPEQVHEHLRNITNKDTEASVFKQSEEFVRIYLKNRNAIQVLFQIFIGSEIVEIRQISGTLIGNLASTHWVRLTPDFKANLKQNLFPVLSKETSRVVLNIIRNLLVTTMKSTLTSSETWPDFMPQLFALTQNHSPDHQEVVLGIFESLLENEEFVKEYRAIFGNLMQLLFSALDPVQPNLTLKISAIRVLAALLPTLHGEEQVSHFRPLLPVILEVISSCIQSNPVKEDEAKEALSAFDDIIESKEAFLFLKNDLNHFMNYILQIGKAIQVPLEIRQQALTTITWLAEFKPKNVLKHNNVYAILQVVFQLLCENPDDDDDEDDTTSPYKFGSYLLNTLALHLSPTRIFEESMKFVNLMGISNNPVERKAAITAIAVLSSGSNFVMTENLAEYMPYLYRALEDPSIIVRRTACIAAGQMADNLQPEISEYVTEILPRLLRALDEADKEIQEKTCYALVTLVEKLDEEEAILPFMEAAIHRLMDLLKNSTCKEIQEMAITGLSAISLAAQDHILPYYEPLMQIMLQLIQITDFNLIRIRGCALECGGVLALSQNENQKQLFAPYLSAFMESAFSGLKEEATAFELRDYTFGFFTRIAGLAGEDFAVFLPEIIGFIKESFESQSGFKSTTTPENNLIKHFVDDPTLITDDNYELSAGFIEGKTTSLNALAVLAYSTKGAFIPFIAEMMPYVTFYLKYYEKPIRLAAIKPAEAMTVMIAKHYPPANGKFVAGVPGAQQPLSNETKQMLDAIMPRHIATITKDKDVEVVTSVLDSIKQLAKQLGPAAIETYMPALGDAIGSAIHGDTTCQQLYEDSDEEAIEEVDEEDEEKRNRLFALTQTACEVVTKFCSIFLERWEYYYPLVELIQRDLLSSSEDNVRQEAVGTFGEIVELLESKVSPYHNVFMKVGIKYMGDSYLPTARNAAFMCGKLCQFCPAESLPYYQELCEWSSRLLSQKKFGSASDNTVSMLCRMIMANFDNVPLDKMLPAIIMNLPLKEDFEEGPCIYPFISQLVIGKHPAIAQYIPNIVHLFASVLDCEDYNELEDDKKEIVLSSVVNTLKFLITEFPDQMQQILSSLQPEQRAKIQSLFTQSSSL